MRSHNFINNNPYLAAKASIWYNKKLLIGKKTFMWQTWARSGINQIGVLFGLNGKKSFTEIKQKFNLNLNEFWKFLDMVSKLI